MTTSCDLDAPRCVTTVPRVRFHGFRGSVFVGHRPPRTPVTPAIWKRKYSRSMQKSYICSDVPHTHTRFWHSWKTLKSSIEVSVCTLSCTSWCSRMLQSLEMVFQFNQSLPLQVVKMYRNAFQSNQFLFGSDSVLCHLAKVLREFETVQESYMIILL